MKKPTLDEALDMRINQGLDEYRRRLCCESGICPECGGKLQAYNKILSALINDNFYKCENGHHIKIGYGDA